MNDLAIVILNWNGNEDTVECLKSLSKNKRDYDIYLLDNGSESTFEIDKYLLENGEYDYIITNQIDKSINRELQFIKINRNLGFSKGNNYIVNSIYDKYPYLLLLNNDTVVPSGTIKSMKKLLEKGKYIGVSCLIYYDSQRDKLWNAGGQFTWYGDRKYYSQNLIDRQIKKGVKDIPVEFLTGCAFMIRSEFIKANGLFTEDFFHGEEDFNFCKNAKKLGYKLGVDLESSLFHKVGASSLRNSNEVKEFNHKTIHYLNRVVDGKNFYSGYRWYSWRALYLILVLINSVTELGIKKSYKLSKRVFHLSNQVNNVKQDIFMKIMNNED